MCQECEEIIKEKANYKLDIEGLQYKVCNICKVNLAISNFKEGSRRCKECNKKEDARLSRLRRYIKNGAKIIKLDDYSSIDWYNYYIDKATQHLPKHIYEDKDKVKEIIRYVIFDIGKLTLKDISYGKANIPFFKKYRLSMTINNVFVTLSACLNYCVPELNGIFKEGVGNYKYTTNEGIISIIEEYMNNKNLRIENLLKLNSFTKEDKTMVALVASKFKTKIELWLWYFDKKQIINKKYNRKYRTYDFEEITRGYWSNKLNRIEMIKEYCEVDCNPSILECIENTDNLKEWIFNNFKSSNISKLFQYSLYYKSLYACLIESYPSIKEHKILFDWEWHQFNTNDKDTLNRELKEFILYRMNGIIVDLEKDIPKYMNMHNMKIVYSKLNKQIDKKRYDSYYDWCCIVFPEYKEVWKAKDFGLKVSKDGNRFDSYIERDIYEFIKLYNSTFKYLLPIGTKHKKGKFTFKLDETYDQSIFCPDYAIEHINIDGKKKELNKPIIIEYYGLADFKRTDYSVITKYNEKVLMKEKYYKSNKDIYYIGIFPEDVKDNFRGLVEKLVSFFMENFQIDTTKII